MASGTPRVPPALERRAGGVDKRAVVLDQAFERLLGQVEPVEFGIAPLELGHDAKRLAMPIELATCCAMEATPAAEPASRAGTPLSTVL